MSTSSHRLKETHKKRTRHSLNDEGDGTSARTRPLTFEEIMIRRKKKSLSENHKDGVTETDVVSRKDLSSRTIEFEKDHRPKKDSLPASERRVVSEKDRNISYGKREKITYADGRLDENLQKGIDTEVPILRRKLKSIVSRPSDDVRNEIEGGRDDKQVRNRRENEMQSGVYRPSDDVRDGMKGGKDVKRVRDNKESEKQSVVSRPSDDVSNGIKGGKDDKRVHDKRENEKQPVVSRPNDDVSNETKGCRDDKRVHDKRENEKQPVVSRPNDDVSNETKGCRDDRRVHDKRENNKRSGDHIHEPGKWYSQDWGGKESHGEQGGGYYERESKRKYRNEVDKNKDKRSAKKPDRRKHYEKQVAEGSKRKELSKRSPDVPKTRRNSRSRDRDDRHKRSKSPSTIAHKRPSHNRTNDREASPHALKDKSKKENHIDGKKLPSNGSGGHYRRNDEGKSGLGGYSPRKRISEATAKTPPPPDQLSSEKKSAKWDILPPGSVINKMLSGSVISSFQPSNSILSTVTQELATKAHVFSSYAKLPSMAAPLPTKTFSSVDSIQLTQSTRPLRRLYVDNIPSSTLEKDLVKWLNDLFLSSGVNHIPGTQPCINCIINKDKAQALVEFLTPEDASTALAFDGRSISGSVLKIRRPRDFVDVATGNLDKLSSPVVDTLSDVVKDSPNKIFIGGISKSLSSKSLMEIVCVFGPLKAYHFEVNGELNEPCAFLEYADQSVTLKACAGLNGMKIGRKVLTVVQALHEVDTLAESSELYEIPQHAKPLLKQPTQVLRLKNVFNIEDISALPEPEVEEVLEDIRLECSRFGNVRSINVVKQRNNDAQTENFNRNLETKNMEWHKNEEPNEFEPVKLTSSVKELQEDEVEKGNSTENESPQPSKPKTETEPSSVLEELPNQLNSPKYEQSENKGDIIVPMDAERSENQSHANSDTGTDRGMVDELDDHNPMMESRAEVRDLNTENMFEMGCVFVEFGRTEAACTTAHCLHGRVFGAKTVSVEYVSLDHYKSRFSK